MRTPKEQWFSVADNPDTWRLAVPGGWLYRVYGATTTTLAFVPTPRVDMSGSVLDDVLS